MIITDDIKYIGVNDHKVDLFEGQYVVPGGMSYNSYALLDEKAILEQVLSQQDLLTESYAAAGIMVSDMELVTIDFLGQERYAIHTTAAMQDVPYFILQIYDYHLGSYGVVTTFASFIEDNTASLPVLFYPLA